MKATSLCLVLLLVLSSGVWAAVLPNPLITTSATPYDTRYVAANVFDSDLPEYASRGLGINTYIDFDFGSPTRINAFALANRWSQHAEPIVKYDLIFSQNSTFGDADDVVRSFNNPATAQNERGGPLQFFPETTAQYVRWDVTDITGSSSFNHGATEMRFLNGAQGFRVPATVIGGAPPFNPNYAQANAVDGYVGWGVGLLNPEYASQTQGANTYLDFDLGAPTLISGFDIFQRLNVLDHSVSFDMIFSNDPTFATSVATRSYTYADDGDIWTETDRFAPIRARYVRYDVTGASPYSNDGVEEIVFYEVPEPSTLFIWSVLGLGVGLGMAQRRRRTARMRRPWSPEEREAIVSIIERGRHAPARSDWTEIDSPW